MKNTCILCKSLKLNILLNFTTNNVVTSDNKIIKCNFKLLQCEECHHIQKLLEPTLIKTINSIYDNYEAYYLNNGEEECRINENNTYINRSKQILDIIKPLIKNNGNILDVGSGSGVFLKEFSKKFLWNLSAQDIKDNLNDEIKNNYYFKNLYLIKNNNLPQKEFDLISAIHVFEHILDTESFLKNIKSALKEDGLLLLQIPKVNENIFDIFIIDHISHFYCETIYFILNKYFKFIYFPKKQIKREITVIASNSEINNDKYYKKKDKPLNIKSDINNILFFLNDIDRKIAIFGTSPPALFCASFLNFKIEYFVDENKNKIGKKLYGKKILSFNDIDKSIEILFPYSEDIFKNVSSRYPTYNFIHLTL